MGRARDRAPHTRARSGTSVRQKYPAPDGATRFAGVLGARRIWRRGNGLRQSRPDLRGARIRRYVPPRDYVRARGTELSDASGLGNRRSETTVSRAAGAGTEDLDLRADRAICRQRRTRDSDGGREEERPLLPDRREDVDFTRRRGG